MHTCLCRLVGQQVHRLGTLCLLDSWLLGNWDTTYSVVMDKLFKRRWGHQHIIITHLIQKLCLLLLHMLFVFCYYVLITLGWCKFIKWPAAYGHLAYGIDQCGSSSLCRPQGVSKRMHRSEDWCSPHLGCSYDNCQTGSQWHSFQGRGGDDTP